MSRINQSPTIALRHEYNPASLDNSRVPVPLLSGLGPPSIFRPLQGNTQMPLHPPPAALLEAYKLRHPMVNQHNSNIGLRRISPKYKLSYPTHSVSSPSRDVIPARLLTPQNSNINQSPKADQCSNFHPFKAIWPAHAKQNVPPSAIGSQAHGPPGANVFVFHIPNEWDEYDLALLFAPFGKILSVRIATDKSNGRKLGFGFTSYTNVESAHRAVKALNGYAVAGKRLKVTIKRGEQHPTHCQRTYTVESDTNQLINIDPECWYSSLSAEELKYQESTSKTTATGGPCEQVRSGGQSSSSSPTVKLTDQTPVEEATNASGPASSCKISNPSSNPVQSTSSSSTESSNGAGDYQLRRVESIFLQILSRLGPEQTRQDDWLQSLTESLKSSQVQDFILTLLRAAGVLCEGGN